MVVVVAEKVVVAAVAKVVVGAAVAVKVVAPGAAAAVRRAVELSSSGLNELFRQDFIGAS